ncbi:xylulose kinase-like [Tubulanus polymorphus]|uniref:xylulose kinase-like n=1 Tax=Tubulanus polymorphus TaxID=672921 RepID=UPI003DA3BDC5
MYLGFDLSTQQLKVIITDEGLQNLVFETVVKFDDDLPDFKTDGGVYIHEDQLTVTAPTVMWVKAFDLALTQIKEAKLDVSKIQAISGTGQQHGSVYWKNGSKNLLNNLDPNKTLNEQLKDVFSVSNSPIWMDSSTEKQCQQLEEAVGGAQELANITGSPAQCRLTGNQIAKIYQTNREAYLNTERIGLVSSLGISLFIGDYSPIDHGDGSGMNLMNFRTKEWNQQCLDACAPSLREKLGSPVPSNSVVGDIDNYFVERYGFSSNCKVVAGTGDNIATAAGLRLKPGEIAYSLGTSDVVFLVMNNPIPSIDSNIFVSAMEPGTYTVLFCYKNGSLTREYIRNECTDSSWAEFERILSSTPKGNNSNLGIYHIVQEITPNSVGVYRYNSNDKEVSSFPKDVEVRAVIEGQFLAKRIHAENKGFDIDPRNRIIATGGASSNTAVLQVLADVFNMPVFVQNVRNSAALGCAFRAKHGVLGIEKFEDIFKFDTDYSCAAEPDTSVTQIYSDLAERYRKLEAKIIKS